MSRGKTGFLGLLPLLAALGACEPCAGLSTCGEDPFVSYRGELEVLHPEIPKEGLRVVFRRTGGVALEQDSVSVLTDAQGRFVLRAKAAEAGTVAGELVVRLPGEFGTMRLGSFDLATTEVEGDVLYLTRWKVDPYVGHNGAVFDRATGRPVPGATVEFRRTGGVPIRPDVYTTITDQNGAFGLRPLPLGRGTIRGDLVIRAAPFNETRATVEVPTFDTDEARLSPPSVGRFGVGPFILHNGQLFWEGTGEHVLNATIEFRRTGGIQLESDTIRSASAGGYFTLRARPLAYGEVAGTMIVRPAGSAPDTFQIRLRTLDEDRYLANPPLFGNFVVRRR